jgi:hypothetical protein
MTKVSLAERFDPAPQCEPFSSVWYGDEDIELFERLLSFYTRP